MSRNTVSSFLCACALAVLLAGCSEPLATQSDSPQRPRAAFNDPALAYPKGLAEAAQKCCPGLHLPQQREALQGAWPDSDGAGSVAFFVEGDFNGDSRKDAAVLLVNASGTGVELAIFEGAAQGYHMAHRRALERVDDLVIAAPQEIALLLVRKGDDWAPEAGDVPLTYQHAHDAVAFETRKVDSAGNLIQYKHLIYWDGKKYAEY